uniref:Uncharacterized protein n=1 Tax=Opuntia streptacantha TaxID=393608 RepID=A0A7C8ZWC4_OPUST
MNTENALIPSHISSFIPKISHQTNKVKKFEILRIKSPTYILTKQHLSAVTHPFNDAHQPRSSARRSLRCAMLTSPSFVAGASRSNVHCRSSVLRACTTPAQI